MTTIKTDSLAADYARDLVQSMRDDVESDAIHGGEYMLDYLESVLLDIHYIVDSERRYVGARLLLAYGGPNAWLDTTRGEISVYWASDRATDYAPLEFCELLDEYLSELFEC